MANLILWQGALPARNMVKTRRGVNVHRQGKHGLNRLHKPRFFPVHELRPMPAAAHGPKQYKTGWGTVGIKGGAPLHPEDVAARVLRRDEPKAVEIDRHLFASIA